MFFPFCILMTYFSHFSKTARWTRNCQWDASRWTLTQSCWHLLGVYLGLRFGDYIYILYCPSKRYHAAAEESDNASNPTPHSAEEELLCALHHPNSGEKTRLAQNYLLITIFFLSHAGSRTSALLDILAFPLWFWSRVPFIFSHKISSLQKFLCKDLIWHYPT